MNDVYYYCQTLTPSPSQDGQVCSEWVEVPPQPTLLPNLTVEEANQYANAVIFCLLFAFGWKQLQKVF